MDKETAKIILQSIRPGIDDDSDPDVAEALALAESDEEVAAFFAAEQTFDAAFTEKLAEVKAPEELEARILAAAQASPGQDAGNPGTGGNAIPQDESAEIVDFGENNPRASNPRGLNTPKWFRATYAIAASLVILLALGILAFRTAGGLTASTAGEPSLEGFYTFASEHAQNLTALEMTSADMREIQTFLAQNQMPTVGRLPGEVASMESLGCRRLYYEAGGERIPVGSVCVGKDRVHHIFIVSKNALPGADVPPEPTYEQRGEYAMITWSDDSRIYALFVHGTGQDVQSLI